MKFAASKVRGFNPTRLRFAAFAASEASGSNPRPDFKEQGRAKLTVYMILFMKEVFDLKRRA